MEYMLVIQLPSSSTTEEFDLLIELEDAITEEIGNHGTVDGHDIGSGEMNVFIFTDDPKSAFEHVKKIPLVQNHISNMKVGYRLVGEDEFVPLFPQSLKQLAVS